MTTIPKGKLISIGGSEDKGTGIEPNFEQKANLQFFEFGILKRILSEMNGVDSRVEVITTASQNTGRGRRQLHQCFW